METFIYNDEQIHCIDKIKCFIDEHKLFSKLLINGSAGTGKTTILITSIINIILLNNSNINTVNSSYIKKFIITAPTNKAKDVLVSKYNIYLNCIKNNISEQQLNECNDIVFLTVAQLLSINKVINELGEETFSKGNDKKIATKYNSKSAFNNTVIIIDECSMLDTNTIQLLNNISCPIIYIGDYCQLPPVNETVSPIFNLPVNNNNNNKSIHNNNKIIHSELDNFELDNNELDNFELDNNELGKFELNNFEVIKLYKVERCTNKITLIANSLRDTIYNASIKFNLLNYKINELILYNKQGHSWLQSYIKDIKQKQIDIFVNSQQNNNIINDTMLLAWTNNCCSILNNKIRALLFSNNMTTNLTTNITANNACLLINNNDFLQMGDKVLIKTPYYKYGCKVCPSSIAYITNIKPIKYKPLSFIEWIKLGININQD